MRNLVMGFVAIAFLLIACDKGTEIGDSPEACLDVSASTVKAGDTIIITNCSKNALYSEVYFGDGNLLSKANKIEYIFTDTGEMTLTVLAYPEDPRAEISTATKTIKVLPGLGVIGNEKDPTACFTASLSVASPGQEITFLNCSQDAYTYSWDFGDGNTAETINSTHTFDKAGTFTITLSATSPSGIKTDEETLDIVVGDKYLTAIKLTAFAAKKADGSTWDVSAGFPIPIPGIGTDPDIVLRYGQGGNSTSTTVVNDATDASLPIEWKLDQAIKIDDQEWTFELLDTGYEELGIPPNINEEEAMASWVENLSNLGNNGVIELKSGAFKLELSYKVQ